MGGTVTHPQTRQQGDANATGKGKPVGGTYQRTLGVGGLEAHTQADSRARRRRRAQASFRSMMSVKIMSRERCAFVADACAFRVRAVVGVEGIV